MKFTKSHEWIKIEDGNGVMGITKHAQQELGEIVYVDLPKVGDEVKQDEEICVVESTKAAADIYSPVNGKIIAINENLANNPALLNESPEEKGWLCKIALSDNEQYDSLLGPSEYESLTI